MLSQGLASWHLTFPTVLIDSGRASEITVRFIQMAGDLLAVTDPDTGTIYLRVDAPQRDILAAWTREVWSLVSLWDLGPETATAEVLELRPEERHGVG